MEVFRPESDSRITKVPLSVSPSQSKTNKQTTGDY